MLEEKCLIILREKKKGKRMSIQQMTVCANRKQFIGSRREVN